MECTSGYCNKPAQQLVEAVTDVLEGMPERRAERKKAREEREKKAAAAKCKEQSVPWWFWVLVVMFVLLVISVFIAVLAFALGKAK